jgi:hypothetical protein
MLKSSYEGKGYSFVMYPSREILPPFLGDYRPDAVALKEPGGVVIEVISDRHASSARLHSLTKRFEKQKDWTLEIVTAPSADTSIPTSTKEEIVSELERISTLTAAGQYRAAFLIAWAALEAAVRALLLSEGLSTDRSLVPAQIPELLTRYGFIDQASSIRLRTLIASRNSVAHGDFKRAVGQADVDQLLSLTRDLLNRIRTDADGPSTSDGRE